MFARKLISSLIPSNRLSLTISSPIQSIRRLCETKSNDESKKLIAVVQLNCREDKDENFKMSEKLIREAVSYGCSMAFLPEELFGMYDSWEKALDATEPLDGPTITKYRDLAKSTNIWLSLGGCYEKRMKTDDNRAFNTHLLINNSGEIVSLYRKMHLFDVEMQGPQRIIESNIIAAGDEIVPPVQTPIGKVGLGICYDIRFPEFALSLAKAGADILTYPSYYSLENGSALWETILRARAMENQCYVVGAVQTGYHNSKRTSWGHSMIIDPRGCIVAQVGEDVGLGLAVIDPAVRRRAQCMLPDVNVRRTDIYGEIPTPKAK